MLKFTGLDDLRDSDFYPKTLADHGSAKADLVVRFDEKLRALSRPPQAVIESAVALRAFLQDRNRRKDRDLEALAIAALRYLFGADDAIPDTVDFVGYVDDSIILDAVVTAVAKSPRRRGVTKPRPKPAATRSKSGAVARKKKPAVRKAGPAARPSARKKRK